MKLYRNINKVYEHYRVEPTDYFIEITEHPNYKDYIEVWLYKENYSIKTYMFGINKTKNYLEVIESNLEEYIKTYEEEYVKE